MYKQYLEVKPGKSGNGVFTKVRIPANTDILEITGPILLDSELAGVDDTISLQVGPNTFIGASGDVDDYLNHSCEPNCRMYVVGNRAILFSLYVIPAGAELTFDYSTTSTDTLEEWQMNCKCGSFKCRKTISGNQYLNSDLVTEYKKKNMFPLFILEPNLFQKRTK